MDKLTCTSLQIKMGSPRDALSCPLALCFQQNFDVACRVEPNFIEVNANTREKRDALQDFLGVTLEEVGIVYHGWVVLNFAEEIQSRIERFDDISEMEPFTMSYNHKTKRIEVERIDQ